MTKLAPRTRLDMWDQERPWVLALGGTAYTLLAVLAGLTLPWRTASVTSLAIDISLCAAYALWVLFMYSLHPAWRRAMPQVGIFVAGLLVLTFALVTRDGWFGFLALIPSTVSLKYLPWPWRLAGVSGTGFISAVSQTSGTQGSLLFRLLMFFVALTLDQTMLWFLAWFLWRSDNQDGERKQALADLNEANGRLVATIAENEDLHRQLIAQAREAGVAEERRRMAREIHDTLAQGLTGIVTQLQAAEQAANRPPGDPAGWRRHVAAATQLARDSLSEARRSVDALRPEPLERCRLSEALDDVAQRWAALNGIPVQAQTTGTARPIRPEIEFALLRAAQEALANVARHAHATRVGLTVSYMENEVALDVRDDGIGFDPATLPGGGGFGLIAMRQRIADLSGTVEVESEPGGGTAISTCVPTVSVLADA
jgi:signal transduction histidine kinase